MEKLRIGVIGLGDICQKAYLPTYASLQNEIDFVLASRKIEKAEMILNQYNFTKAVEGAEALLHEELDAVMIHAKTSVHYSLCKLFLKNKIPVFIDKPLSDEIEEVENLQKLAEENKTLLMVGFNRRFAPMIQQLKKVPDKNFIRVSKDRTNETFDEKYGLYDLFIHPLDTALFLLDKPLEKMESKLTHDATGKLIRAFVRLETESSTVIVTMNLQSGTNFEIAEVQTPTGCYTVENLSEWTERHGETIEKGGFSDWTPTLVKRGFDPMVRQFFEAVRLNKEEAIPFEEINSTLFQHNVQTTHHLIDKMMKK